MRKFLERFLAWLKSGWGTTALFGLEETIRRLPSTIWHRIADADTLHDIWLWAGGDMPTLIWLVANPFFGLGLIIIGLIGIPAATRSTEGHAVPRFWTLLGWGVFGSCSAVLAATLLFGKFAESSGVIEARRFYVEKHTERHLTDKQKVAFQKNVCPIAAQVPIVLVWSIHDPEAVQYAKEILQEFTKCFTAVGNNGRSKLPIEGEMGDTTHPGLLVPVFNKDRPDQKSVILFESMKKAGFEVSYSQWEDAGPEPGPSIVTSPSLFVSYR